MAANSQVQFFEGVEKRLQLDFSGTNLRDKLNRAVLEKIVEPVECLIEGVLSGDHVDAYLLSASSLFVYDDVVIIKTCGATKIFECIDGIVDAVGAQKPRSVKYTRGSFFRPELQPYPHQTLCDEEEMFLFCMKKYKLEIQSMRLGTNQHWHIMNASSPSSSTTINDKKILTIEMCMRDLDREKAALYYKETDGRSTMLNKSGVGQIFPEATVSAHEFDPFGFSMNSVEGLAISTIHVSPQPDSSYASFEAVGYDIGTNQKLTLVIEKTLSCFRPSEFTLAIYNGGDFDLLLQGYNCMEKFILPLGPGGPVSFFEFLAV